MIINLWKILFLLFTMKPWYDNLQRASKPAFLHKPPVEGIEACSEVDYLNFGIARLKEFIWPTRSVNALLFTMHSSLDTGIWEKVYLYVLFYLQLIQPLLFNTTGIFTSFQELSHYCFILYGNL